MRLNGYLHARQFDADEAAVAEPQEPEASADSDAEPPDYSFEGFSVDFIDKVALLPVAPRAPKGI
jgi:hypothetical protein